MLIKDVAEKVNVDPSYLSHLLSGRVSLADSDYFLPLIRLLRLTPEEVRAIKPGAVIVTIEGSEEDEPSPLLPDELLEAAEQFGNQVPALRNPRIQHQLAAVRHWDGGPRTPQDWLDFYLDNRRRFREN